MQEINAAPQRTSGIGQECLLAGEDLRLYLSALGLKRVLVESNDEVSHRDVVQSANGRVLHRSTADSQHRGVCSSDVAVSGNSGHRETS